MYFTFSAKFGILEDAPRKTDAKTEANGMFRIWAKIMKDGKIIRQYTYEGEEKLTWSHFHRYLFEICDVLDCPTPVLLKSHILNFAKFNHVRFAPGDFVESVSFDFLVLEQIVL